MNTHLKRSMLPVLFGFSAVGVTAQEDARWPQFLGPGGKNSIDTSPSTLNFDVEQDLLWKTPLPGGGSSPCIWDDQIFITAAEDGDLYALALDRSDGTEIWRETVKRQDTGPIAHVDATPAVSTPCTDGEVVVFYFGGYGLIATDLDGEVLWREEMPAPQAAFGIGTSPILLDDVVILSRDGCPDSGIFALDRMTGEQRWFLPRVRFGFSFGTPYLWKNKLRRELIVGGTQTLISLDPETGKELWRVGNLTSLVCTTPMGDDESLYFAGWSTREAAPGERTSVSFGVEFTEDEMSSPSKMYARMDKDGNGEVSKEEITPSRAVDSWAFLDSNRDGIMSLQEFSMLAMMPTGNGRNLAIAVKAGGKGDVSKTHVSWTVRRGLPYVASPLLHEGRLYMAKAGGILTCLDPATGDKHFDTRLGDRSEYYATPLGVAGHIIVCASGGTIFVVKAGDEYELVRSVELGERLFATPAVAEGTVYVRSDQALWAFGK